MENIRKSWDTKNRYEFISVNKFFAEMAINISKSKARNYFKIIW